MSLILLLFVCLTVFVAVNCVKVVPQTQERIVERLGSFYTVWGNGLHFCMPFIDAVSPAISLKERVYDFPPQPVITKDNVTMSIDTVVYFKVMDSKAYRYGVERPIAAIENLTATTLRNIIGDLDLDGTLTSRDVINAKMRAAIDEASDPWGIKVTRVEVKNITPPAAIQQAMEKQMKAEREKRETILLAEAERESAVKIAQGRKEAKILSAEADKQAAILAAQAEKQRQIEEAEGEAQAILAIQNATADGIRAVRAAGADDAVLTLQAYEALKIMAQGPATTLFLPTEIQNLAGLGASLKEVIKK